MPRYLIIAILCFCCGAVLACKSYTSGLQQSVTRADETAGIAALHTISVAQRTYSTSNGGSYGTFEQLVGGGYLDSRFSSDKPNVRGYVLSMTVTSESEGSRYAVNADPEGAGPQAAGRHFYLDSTSGLIHVNSSQPASARDPALDQ